LLGHRHISTTMRYLHLAQPGTLSVASRMNLLDALNG
jgi:integrase